MGFSKMLEVNKKTQIFKSKQGVNFCGYKINEYRLKIRDKGKRMNICFIKGKIITKPEYKFIFISNSDRLIIQEKACRSQSNYSKRKPAGNLFDCLLAKSAVFIVGFNIRFDAVVYFAPLLCGETLHEIV